MRQKKQNAPKKSNCFLQLRFYRVILCKQVKYISKK